MKSSIGVYHPSHIKSLKDFYRESDPTTWPFYTIVMPLTAEGYGPADLNECHELTWEVWDRFCNSYGSFKYLPEAIGHAIDLNKELFNATAD